MGSEAAAKALFVDVAVEELDACGWSRARCRPPAEELLLSFEGQSFFMCPVAEHSKHLPAFGVDPHSCKNWHSAPRRQPESLFANHLQGFAEVEVEVEAAGGLAFAFAPGSTSPVACIPFTFAVLSAWPPRLASALVEVAALDLAELVESPSASANRCLWSARIVSSVGFVSKLQTNSSTTKF